MPVDGLPDAGDGFEQQVIGHGIDRLATGPVGQAANQQGDTEDQRDIRQRQPLA